MPWRMAISATARATARCTDLSSGLGTSSLSLKDFIAHLVPRSVFEAMANNEILQIVVFSLFFGVACAALGEKAKTVVAWTEELSHVILKVTGYIMLLAPLAVFASMAAIITTQGLGILLTYGTFVAEFYLGLGILWVLMAGVGFLFFGRRVFELISLIRQPFPCVFAGQEA